MAVLLDEVFFRNGFWVLRTPACYERDTRLCSACSNFSSTIYSGLFLPDPALLAGKKATQNRRAEARSGPMLTVVYEYLRMCVSSAPQCNSC